MRMIALFFFAVLSLLPAFAAASGYGAIALNSETGRYGYAYNQQSRASAEVTAQSHCGANCRPILWFANGCAALAQSANRFGAGVAQSPAVAERKALNTCGMGRCRIVLSQCSGKY